MSNLAQAINNQTLTENGAEAFESSLNKNLDLFFRIGASRGRDLSADFVAAYKENANLATRILLWSRDVRGGAGERQQFRNLVSTLINRDPMVASRVLRKVPEVGRWDDLMTFMGTPLQSEAVDLWTSAIVRGDGLAAKWAPRKDKKGAAPLRRALGMSEKAWRHKVVSLTDVVEQKMCANKWTDIEYGKVPSVASARYQRAFSKHDPEGYMEYKFALESGEAKINAGAVYPHDIINSLRNGDKDVANAQWKALPNYLEGSSEQFLPMIDVSGSMSRWVSGSVTAMDVAVSLGMYIAERNESVFKDQFITFSATPEFQTIKGTKLAQRHQSIVRSDWGFNTNVEAAFKLILDAAVKHNLPQEDMPTKLLVLSDMQFDSYSVEGATAFGMVRKHYKDAGYEMPQLVWWNLDDRRSNIPVTENSEGNALVSGFSPSIMKSLLKGKLTPVNVLLDTVTVERYDY